tara:strand:+ start:309 stop:485 length:177 start_codon:yes stop_codon:yes gene_type:complete
MENDKKKKFDPLATDWLMGNVGEEEAEKSEEPTEDKVNEDTVEFKNILEEAEETSEGK